MGSQDVAPRSVGNGSVGGCGSQDIASGLATGRPETIPREDPADPGPGARLLLFFKGRKVFNGGGAGPRREDFLDPPTATNPSDLKS